ncbi:hypothetical protein [Ulvibacterium marinum]|uniref:hypothetical protein n=1 Tax=Ulvibacterium marinum TaxID=2419782 RepID=UPI003742618F
MTNNGIEKHIERINKLMNLAVKLEWIKKIHLSNIKLSSTSSTDLFIIHRT